jgi:hypothetical protein
MTDDVKQNNQARTIRFVCVAGVFLSALVMWELLSYIYSSDSNHTSFEPWLLLVIFGPTAVAGAAGVIRRRSLVASLLALILGLGGTAFLYYIDHNNIMVQYDRWLEKDMPLARW